MHRLHIADPDDFFRLPDAWQRLHLQHTRNHLQGQYEQPLDRHGNPIPVPGEAARKAIDIEAWREKRQQTPPSPAEVAAARQVLALPNVHPEAAEAARQTLARAEAA